MMRMGPSHMVTTIHARCVYAKTGNYGLTGVIPFPPFSNPSNSQGGIASIAVF